MDVSGINNQASVFPYLLNLNDDKDDRSGSAPMGGVQDMVDVHMPTLLSDDEVDDVMADTLQMIGDDPTGALSVHSGLNESRVFALLGMV